MPKEKQNLYIQYQEIKLSDIITNFGDEFSAKEKNVEVYKYDYFVDKEKDIVIFKIYTSKTNN